MITPTTRRGACPSLANPMKTGDGLIARLAPARGFYSPTELQSIAALAAKHGNGVLEISKRGNLQIRGLSETSAPLLASGIAAASIEIGQGPSIDISPLAGFDPTERRDPRAVKAAISEQLANKAWTNRLGAKVSVIVDAGGKISLSQLIADIRLVAAVAEDGGTSGWHLYAGGTQNRARHLGVLANDDAAAAAVILLLERIARKGNAARGRDLGTDDFAAPGELNIAPVPLAPPRKQQASTLPIGITKLSSGVATGFGLPFGSIIAAQLAAFAQATEKTGASEIRLAPGKVMLALFPDTTTTGDLITAAADLGLITSPDDPRCAIVTCAGAPACASAHIDTHQLAAEVLSGCSDLLDGTFCIHISGCARRCADPGGDALHVIAGENLCEIFRDIETTSCCATAERVPVVVKQLLSTEPVARTASHPSPVSAEPKSGKTAL